MLLWIISIISHCLFRTLSPVIECAADFCLGYLIYYHNNSRKINKINSFSEASRKAGVKTSPTTIPEHKQNFVSSIRCIGTVKASQLSVQTHQVLKSRAKLHQRELQMNTTHAKILEPLWLGLLEVDELFY